MIKLIKITVLLLIAVCAILYTWYLLDSTLETKVAQGVDELIGEDAYSIGATIDELNGVKVFYNGSVRNVLGRNTTPDGYNLGLKYQCVEFIKRYYYQRFNHKMPDALGHAKSFFDKDIDDGDLNQKRMLLQYSNGGSTQPQAEDIIVFGPALYNPYGHVAIIAKVEQGFIEIIQQNAGKHGETRAILALHNTGGAWSIDNNRTLGWLRLPPKVSSKTKNNHTE